MEFYDPFWICQEVPTEKHLIVFVWLKKISFPHGLKGHPFDFKSIYSTKVPLSLLNLLYNVFLGSG